MRTDISHMFNRVAKIIIGIHPSFGLVKNAESDI